MSAETWFHDIDDESGTITIAASVTTVHDDGTRTVRRYSRPRDSQRGKLYAAEQDTPMWQSGRRFTTVEEVQAYVDHVMGRAYVQRHFTGNQQKRITVRPGNGMRRGHAYGTSAIALPKFARHEMYILHELAHCLDGDFVFEDQSHGWKFCRTYLMLVGNVMGRDAGTELKESFKRHRVRSTERKPGRKLTPEQRAKAAETLAAARTARLNRPTMREDT